MVYINSRGEVIDDSRPSPTNIFWKVVTFIVLFFKSLIGIEDATTARKKDDDLGRPKYSFPSGGGGGSGGSGGSGGGPRKFGPRGFKSVTDLPPPPMPMGGCAGGACG